MTKRITTYEELLLEKHRLKLQLHGQKELLRQDIAGLKEQIKPVQSAISFLTKITTRDPENPLINGTVNSLIDSLVKNVLLARAGWFMKLAVPFFMKNFASHAIDEKKDKILKKIFSLFKKKSKKAESNGHYHYAESEEEE
jgi:hypothetical protein